MNAAPASPRIPTLDGWRGIAILLVLFEHARTALVGYGPSPWVQTGQHGVTVFFVLSGFLITTTLLSRPIDLKSFYVRRFFRLMPVAWTYLGVLLLLNLRVHVVSSSAIVSSVFFYRNYVLTPFGSDTWHFWSLSIEEQFYVIWPAVLLLAGARRSLWIAAGGTMACALYRFANWSYFNREYFHCHTQVRADAPLVGCVLALCLYEPAWRAQIARWSGWLVLPAACVWVYCVGKFTLLPPLAESVSIGLLLAASVLHPRALAARPLSWRWLSMVGLISYSLYVWQELFMLMAPSEGLAARLVLLAGILPCLVVFSYFYIERPLTRVGHTLSARVSAKRQATAMPAHEAQACRQNAD